MCQTERRPFTTLATFSSLHSGKLSSFENNLSSVCDASDYSMAGSALADTDPSVPCAVSNESLASGSNTLPLRPFSEQCAAGVVPNLLTCSSETVMDSMRSTMAAGASWVAAGDSCYPADCGYDVVDYPTVCDRKYYQAADNSLTAYTAAAAATADVYQRSGYQSAEWTAEYHPTAILGRSACCPDEFEDSKDRVAGSLLSAVVSSDQLSQSGGGGGGGGCQTVDCWATDGGVGVKKLKQERAAQTEQARCSSQSSRRASTGSLLCTNSPDLVS